MTRLSFRLAFYSSTFDLENAPCLFSEEKLAYVDSGSKKISQTLQLTKRKDDDMVWTEESLPQMHTALNSPELMQQSSFLMLLLGTTTADVENDYLQQLSDTTTLDEQVMGQAIIKMEKLDYLTEAHYLFREVDLVCGNFKIADAKIKLRYTVKM